VNIFKRGAIALAGLAMAGTTFGLVTASSASAAGPFVVTATQVEVSDVSIAPNVTVQTFNEYQPSVLPPGFTLFATVSALCLTGPRGNSACTWRLTTNAPPILSKQLRGNLVIGPKGQAGNITGGTKTWFGARGITRSINLAPAVSSATWVFTTP
jgi:hypothetical protein